MKGTLYIVGTPIGNLEDITLRALKVLREVDIVLAEDTRRTRLLLKHYGISKKLISFHEHNEEERIPMVVNMLDRGLNVALLSDAGMPTIEDPGYRIVRYLRLNGYRVTCVPGPSSVTAAISISGLPTDRFVFEGFLPKRKGRRRKRLEELKDEERTIVIFLPPHRVEEDLEEIEEVLGDREAALLRELTKIHEEVLFGKLSEIRRKLKIKKGEFVIVVRGRE